MDLVEKTASEHRIEVTPEFIFFWNQYFAFLRGDSHDRAQQIVEKWKAHNVS